MFKKRLIEILRALELPVDEIETVPIIGMLNPMILTALMLEYIDLLPPEKQANILHKPPIESLLNNRRIISALDFICLYDAMASSKISLKPAPAPSEVKSITDLYSGFRDVLYRICCLLEAIVGQNTFFYTQHMTEDKASRVVGIEENPLGLSPLIYCMKNNKEKASSNDLGTAINSFLDDSSTIQTKHDKSFEFVFTDADIKNFTCRDYNELPFSLDNYVYKLNLAVLRRVGVCTAPHDIHFSFNLTTTVCHTSINNTGTYYVPLHSPAPIILQPESSTFDQIEPELIELSRVRTVSDSEDNDNDGDGDDSCDRSRTHMLTRSQQIEEPIEILNHSYIQSDIETISPNTHTVDAARTSHTVWRQISDEQDGITLDLLPSSTDTKQKWIIDNLYEEDNNSKFSHLPLTASDKIYEVSPSGSQHNSFRASIEDNKSLSHSYSQGSHIYNSDEDDSLTPSRVTFNDAVEVDPGRYYKIKPFDEMQDVMNSIALINNMAVHIHELEEKVSALMSENDHLLNKYKLTLNEHESEKASLNKSLSEALQKIRTLETKILELDIKQSSGSYFTKLSASSIEPERSYIFDPELTRSLTARPQHTRQYPEISFSPAPSDDTTIRSAHKEQKDTKYNATNVSVTAVVPQVLSTPTQSYSYSNKDYTLIGQRSSLFSNMNHSTISPRKSIERRYHRAESLDSSSQHLKKAKKQRHTSPEREKKDSKDTSSNASSALVKEMLEKIINSSSIQDKAYLIGANRVKAEILSSQIRSLSIEREAPKKPPGSPTSNARRFRHTSVTTRGNRQ